MKIRAPIVFASLLLILCTSIATAAGLLGCKEHVKYGVPSHSEMLLCRLGYGLSHDGDKKVPIWVAYHLTKEHMAGTHPRSDDFRPDPDLEPGQRAELADYKNSGYDRGHMAPAADMRWDARAMSESFLLSNMAPQVGIGFNRGIWAVLEGKIRDWTIARGELYLVTGPIFAPGGDKRIGKNKVSVPTHFYQVVFDPVRVEAIAFILPNKKLKADTLSTYITSVDEVEKETGLDFHSELEDSVEVLIEAKVQPGMW